VLKGEHFKTNSVHLHLNGNCPSVSVWLYCDCWVLHRQVHCLNSTKGVCSSSWTQEVGIVVLSVITLHCTVLWLIWTAGRPGAVNFVLSQDESIYKSVKHAEVHFDYNELPRALSLSLLLTLICHLPSTAIILAFCTPITPIVWKGRDTKGVRVFFMDSRSRHCCPISYYAILYSTVADLDSWTHEAVNFVLSQGDSIHKSVKHAEVHFDYNELLRCLSVANPDLEACMGMRMTGILQAPQEFCRDGS